MSAGPISLPSEAIGSGAVSAPEGKVPVLAWVTYEDARHREVRGSATGWTDRAVGVTWQDDAGATQFAWVWSAAVTRLIPWGSGPERPSDQGKQP